MFGALERGHDDIDLDFLNEVNVDSNIKMTGLLGRKAKGICRF
jgi:hypothetical protein